MKIAVSASGATLNSDIDPRFGRCQYFIIVDSDTMAFEAIENSASMSSGGAGISAGQQIADKGAEVVLTGNCGPNAYQTLSAAGIKVVTGVSGKVKTAIYEYKGGKFEQASQANVVDHHGKESINFQITFTLILILAPLIAFLVTVNELLFFAGCIVLAFLALFYLMQIINSCFLANRGVENRYPFALRLIK